MKMLLNSAKNHIFGQNIHNVFKWQKFYLTSDLNIVATATANFTDMMIVFKCRT